MLSLLITLMLSISAPAADPIQSGYSSTPITISHFKKNGPGIYSGGSPELEEVIQLRNLGVRTVINLQGDDFLLPLILPSEWGYYRRRLGQVVRSYGMRYVNSPMPASRFMSESEEMALLRAVALLNDPRNHPVYIHCSRGADRTGLAIALYRVIYQGWSEAQALAEMKKNGHQGIQYLLTPQLRWFLSEIAEAMARAK